MQVTDVAAWYRDRHPSLPPGSIVPGRCFFCWQEINEGDRVVVRKIIGDGHGAQPNEKGIVKTILSSEDGSLFVVMMDSGKEAYLIRAEFRKQRENEAEQTVGADRGPPT
jgi:hypothetical protein